MSKIATIITDLVEDIEVTSPKEALENAGHEVVIISNEGVDTVTGKKGTAFAPGGKWHALYMCNPISPIVNLFRYAYLGTGAIEWKYYFIGWGITLALLFIGIVLFSRVEKTFMDTV